MKFARIVFGIAAAYGFVSLVPLYFMIEKVGRDAPPAITHPELYYGFIGLALLWQLVFVLIAVNPVRYRPIMLVAVLEKFVYTVPVVIPLFTWQGALQYHVAFAGRSNLRTIFHRCLYPHTRPREHFATQRL